MRRATVDDMPELINLACAYAGESEQHRQISPEQTRRALELHLNCSDSQLTVVDGQNCIAASSLAVVDRAFTVDPQALVMVFYVREPYRGTMLARRLLVNCLEFAQNKGCSHIWAGSNGLIGEQEGKMFDNLCSKAGFKHGGNTFYKVLK